MKMHSERFSAPEQSPEDKERIRQDEATAAAGEQKRLLNIIKGGPEESLAELQRQKVLQQDTAEALRLQNLETAQEGRIDEVTGGENRRGFMDLAMGEAAIVARETQRIKAQGVEKEVVPALTFMVVDLDLFKPINDTYGHATGDRVLASVMKHLKERFARKGDVVARAGGDEFWALATGDIHQVHDRLNLDNGTHFGKIWIETDVMVPDDEGGMKPLVVFASVGLAAYERQDGESIESSIARTLEEADSQTYNAKEVGEHR